MEMKRVENHGNLQQKGLKLLWFERVEHEMKIGGLRNDSLGVN